MAASFTGGNHLALRAIIVLLCLTCTTSAEEDAAAGGKGVSAERLLRLVQGKSPEVAAARVRAIGAMKTPEATSALIGLTKDSRGPVVIAAIEAIEKRLKGKRPYVLPSHKDALMELARELIQRNQFEAAGLPESSGVSLGMQIYRAIGDQTTYGDFKITVEAFLYAETDDDALLKELIDTAWFLFCDRADQPPKDLSPYQTKDAQPDDFTFLRLLGTRDDFRPDNWEDTLELAILSEFVEVREYAMKYLPTDVGEQTYKAISLNIYGRYQAYPSVQIASLEAAAKSQSIYFLPAIRKIITDTEDPAKAAVTDEDKSARSQILVSARKALKACTPAPLDAVDPREEFPAIPFPEKKVAELMRRVEKLDRVPDAIKQLRELTGLDFGDASTVSSRRGWMAWNSRERVNTRSAGPDGRPFVMHGRVTDANEKPIPGARVVAHVQTRLHRPGGVLVAYTSADNNGRYVLRFGFGKRASDLPARTYYVDASDGRKLKLAESDKPPGRIISHSNLADDPILGIRRADCLLPGQPLKQDFVLRPGS